MIGLTADEISIRHVRKMSRTIGWISIIIQTTNMCTHWLFGLQMAFWVSLPWLLGFILMTALMYTKKEAIARVGVPLIATLAIFSANEFVNGTSKFQYYYFAASCLSIFMLTPREVRSWRSLNAVFPIVLFLFQEATHYQFLVGPQNIPSIHISIMSQVSILGTAIVTIGTMYFSMHYLFRSHKELSIMGTELAQQNRNSALGMLANGMAHEINNPLSIITSAASLIERSLQEPEINKLKLLEHTGRIKNTVNRIAKLITSLRNFSSEENSDQTDTEAFLFELVEDVSSLMSESFRSNGIFFENATPAQILIRCRRTDLQQAIYNLIHNSIDAIRHQSFRWIKVESSLTDKSIQILVTDSGLGIPKEIADKMMIPFFTTKEVGQGTGLGLSLSKGLIEKHGGKLFLDKSSAHTCFIIELPKDLLILNKKAS